MSEAVRAGAVRPASRVQSVLWFVVNHPVRLLLVTVLLALVTGAGLQHASINNSDRALFARDNPGLQQLEAVESRFTKDDSVVIIVRPHDGDVFTRRNLTLLSELTEQAWTIPHTQRVDSLTNFQHTEVDGDDLNVTDLVSDPDQLSDAELVRIRDIALREPNLVRNVVSERGHAATINVSVVTESDGGREAPAIMEVVETLRADFSARYPDVDILLTGMVAFKAASQATTEHEIKTTSLFSMAAILLCLLVMLRSVSGVVVTLLVITLSNLIAMGTMVWFGVEITPVMAGAPAIILTLAVADSIHLLISYQQFLREGLGKQVAMYESLRVNASPVFLTSITTAIGFLCLNASQSPPFVDMANLVTIGVMAAWLLSMVFLPALMMLLPTPKLAQHSERHAWMDHLADFVIDHRKPVLVVSVLVFGGLAALSVKNQFNDVWIDYFDETYEVRRATDFMVQEITGHHRLQFAFPSGVTNGIMDPVYMQGLDRFAEWARQQPGVKYVSSFSDTIKRLNRDMHGGDPAFYKIPDERELIAQYVLMFQMSLPFGLGLENQIDMDQSAVRVNVLLGDVTSNDIMAFEETAAQWIEQQLPASMHTRGVGFDLLLGQLSYENGQSMLQGTALALVLTSLLLVVALRSLRYGLLSMLPNLFPALISFGIWALVDGYIGISVSIVACMTLGIVIDNTVHLLSKYTRARAEQGLSAVAASRYAFKTVGVALVATTLVISANFGMMALSHYYPNASMGLLTSITVAVALAVNFFFFVPVLLYIDRNHNNQLRPLPQPVEQPAVALARAA